MQQRSRLLSVAVVVSFLFVFDLAAQKSTGGRRQDNAASGVSPSTLSITVQFPNTPAHGQNVQDCWFNCFYQIGSNPDSCNASGTVTLVRAVRPPFRVMNLRRSNASTGCGGTPVTLPVTLAPGEALLQDFVFEPTTNGSFMDDHVYTLAPANGTADTFSWHLVGSTGVAAAPRIVQFGAVPPRIRPGERVTLGWLTQNATSVVISGLGAQPLSGTATVTPSQTTTYTLTAMSGSASTTEDVTVNVITAPSIVVSGLPRPILQLAGVGGGTTRYAVTNNGGGPTSVTVTQSGTFFTQAPQSFPLAAGATQIVTVTGNAVQTGAFEGDAILTATNVPGQVTIPIKVFSTPAPTGPVSARAATNRVDVSAPPGGAPSGNVSFRNLGNSPLVGVAVADVPWLIPQRGLITIPAGGTGNVSFTVNRALRAESDNGSSSGSIALFFPSGPALVEASQANPVPPVSTTLVTVVDTVQLTVGTSTAPPLAAGEVALFIPGVGHIAGSVGTFISDVSVLNPPGNRTINDIRFFYAPIGGGTPRSTTLPPLASEGVNIALADVVKNVFGSDAQVGSLQIRSTSADKLSVSTNVFNSTNPAGTYGTALPVFRSDRGIAAGEQLVLTGLRRDATSHTNLFIQETSGLGVSVSTEFISASGASLGTRTDTVGAFGLSQINNVVPQGAVAAILTNASTGAGRFLAYATPVDDASGDNWSVVDWSRQYGYSGSEQVIIPVAGVVQGANNTFFRTDLAITNSGATQATGTLRYIARTGEVSDRPITLAARSSSIISNVIGSLFSAPSGSLGYLLFTPSTGTFVINSRTYTTVAGAAATFGTAVPTLAASASLKNGALRAIGALEDAALTTITSALPATFRTNFGLLETSGQSVTVRVTLRFSYPAGPKLSAVGSASKDYELAPNQFLQLNRVSAEILGTGRDSLGDLRNLELDFQVVGGNGAIAVFTSSTDNGTGDSILRTD